MSRPESAPVSGGALAGTCPTCGEQLKSEPPIDNFSDTKCICQEIEPKKMGRPRKRSLMPTHRTPGRSGYRAGCGCVECTDAQNAYQESYNARKRVNERNAELNDTESAA